MDENGGAALFRKIIISWDYPFQVYNLTNIIGYTIQLQYTFRPYYIDVHNVSYSESNCLQVDDDRHECLLNIIWSDIYTEGCFALMVRVAAKDCCGVVGEFSDPVTVILNSSGRYQMIP